MECFVYNWRILLGGAASAAILAVGSVSKVPVVVDNEVAIGHRMKLTLSSDHRVVDGALAAQFLQEVRRLLENPVTLFV